MMSERLPPPPPSARRRIRGQAAALKPSPFEPATQSPAAPPPIALPRTAVNFATPAPTSLEPTAVLAPLPVSALPESERRAFHRVGTVLLGLCAVIGATYLIPPLFPLRPWVPGESYVPFWNIVGRELLGQKKQLAADAAKVAALQRHASPTEVHLDPKAPRPKPAAPVALVFPKASPELQVQRPEYGIEPPESLDYYFRKLTLAELGGPGAIARAGHWGDSVLGVDGITSGIRRRLQSRFGDAGHGFHLIDRYNPSYRQQGIQFLPSPGWSLCLVVFECNKQDHRYGYGGLMASSPGGAAAAWGTTADGFGKTASLFELWFARQPYGGRLELLIDGKETVRVDTRGPDLQDDWQMVYVQPGAHTFMVRAAGGGSVRAYGIVLENDGPGVVWDGISLIGGSTRALRTQDPGHIAAQVRHRDLDLIAFMFGGNDMQRNHADLSQSMQPYYDEYSEVIQRFRAGKPEASCLVLSVTDHGERLPNGQIVSRKFAKQLSLAQREVARRNGCGFFDTYQAMGGDGAVDRWYRATPRLISPDLGHPNSLGHEVIAGLIADALLHGYQEYRGRMEGQPLPELARSAAQTQPGPNPTVPAPGSAAGAAQNGEASTIAEDDDIDFPAEFGN